MWKFFIFCGLMAYLQDANAGYSPELGELLDRALKENRQIKSSVENSRAEKKLVTSKYNLSDPSIGISNLNRGNETEYITVQQRFRFPTKYWLEGKAQKRIYESSQENLTNDKLRLREQIVNSYYRIYSIQKTIELTRTNLQIVKDFARVAEKKYASGKSSQADSMKAHFEITQLEIDILKLEQSEEELQALLKSLMGDSTLPHINLVSKKIAPPSIHKSRLNQADTKIKDYISEHSPKLKSQEKKMEAANYKKSLAKWEFAPDFSVQYQERIAGLPEDSRILSVNATFPLWFWKNSAESSHASAKALSEEYRYQDLQLKMVAKFRALKARLEKMEKTLVIYKTTLMPQAEGAYRSTRSGYKAGKTTFLNLLDSERSLYKVKQDYFKALNHFVEAVTEMESLLGQPISSLYGVKGVLQ